MPLSSPLFWLIILFLVVLVWFDGVAAGRRITPDEGKPAKSSIWQRGGAFCKRFLKKPTPASIVALFLVLLLLRLLLGLAPLLLFLLAAWGLR